MLGEELGNTHFLNSNTLQSDMVYQKCRSSKNLLMLSLYQPYEHDLR